MSEFQDRVAIVTGASSGIGRETAIRFAEEGARVVVNARDSVKLDDLVSRYHGRMIAVPGDLSELATIERMFDEAKRSFGDCDILVNNAGMVDPRPLVETTPQQWDRMFAVNTRSVYAASREAIRVMAPRRAGVIVNVASISGIIGPEKFPGFVSYCASKAAVIMLTEALASEVKDLGIRVNCVSPGSVDTDMLRRANESAVPDMTAVEVARVILFLASSESRPMNGQNVHVYSA